MIIKLMLAAVGMVLWLSAVYGGESRAPAAEFLGRKEGWDYAAMRAVAERFTGTQGVVLHLGDSITVQPAHRGHGGTEGRRRRRSGLR
jgi:hypothetical protein